MRLILPLVLMYRYAESCAATSSTITTTTVSSDLTTTTTLASDTTTTTSATDTTATSTTSTTSTTTTTTTGSCSSCTANQIVFSSEIPNTDQNIDAMGGAIMTNPTTGCVTINAICAAATGQIAFMQFNGNEGGPLENAGLTQTVTAQLMCVNGQWYYDVRAVNEVNCSGHD